MQAMTSSDTVAWNTRSKFETFILNQIIVQQYPWLIYVNFQYQVWPLLVCVIPFH